MGNRVWAEARVRARAETLDLLKLDSLPRALLTLGTPIVAFAATLGLTGQLAIAAVATVAWTVLCGALIYLGKLIRAPAKIAVEKQEELDALTALPAIPKHALLITADTESDAADDSCMLNLRVKNTTPIALEVGGVIGYFRINAGEATPIKCSRYLLHVGGQCSYQFPLGDRLKEPKDGTIEMVIKLTYGLPGEAPARTVEQVLNVAYQYRGAITFFRCSNAACSETEI